MNCTRLWGLNGAKAQKKPAGTLGKTKKPAALGKAQKKPAGALEKVQGQRKPGVKIKKKNCCQEVKPQTLFNRN